ncbi:MAG: hypothetical protein NC904_04945, partial [Candidatus Omnitrophica bacterium]|nr:hypothetical protein [Candidatus Omnitrophota bacterium]
MFKFKYLLFLLFLGACTYAKYVDNYYTIPNFSKLKVSDVGFVGFVSKEKLPQDIISRVNDIFSTELERRNWYRVHRLKEDDLKDFDKLSNIDALIEGEIICYKELEPLKFGLRVWMKYINTGQTIWSSSYIFDASAKYGTNYFANYIHSDMKPEDIRSMCCRLRLNLTELYNRGGGGLFGSGSLTGS